MSTPHHPTFVVFDDREPDGLGRRAFTLFWLSDGIFRPELHKDGKPVGYRRAQCFCTQPDRFLKDGAEVVTEPEAESQMAELHEELIHARDAYRAARGDDSCP